MSWNRTERQWLEGYWILEKRVPSSWLGFGVNLLEFPLTVLYGVTGDGLVSRPVQVCALVALTECLLFMTLHPVDMLLALVQRLFRAGQKGLGSRLG